MIARIDWELWWSTLWNDYVLSATEQTNNFTFRPARPPRIIVFKFSIMRWTRDSRMAAAPEEGIVSTNTSGERNHKRTIFVGIV